MSIFLNTTIVHGDMMDMTLAMPELYCFNDRLAAAKTPQERGEVLALFQRLMRLATDREIAAGRMAEDDELHTLAVAADNVLTPKPRTRSLLQRLLGRKP